MKITSVFLYVSPRFGQAVKEVKNMGENNEKQQKNRHKKVERPISKVYPVIDNDLARDNVENDIPAADLEDL